MLYRGEKGASNPGGVRWSRSKFTKMNNLEKGEFKG